MAKDDIDTPTKWEKYSAKYLSAEDAERLSKIKLATLTNPDGSQEQITGREFVGIISAAADVGPTEKALKLLEVALAYAETIDELKEDPKANQTLTALRRIYDYWMAQPEKSDLEKFLREEISFMVTPRPAGIEHFLKINDAANIRQFENMKVSFAGRLGIDEQKINEMIRLGFSAQNYYKAKTNLNLVVELPFKETMQILGRKITPENEKKFAQRLSKQMLPAIAHQSIDLTENGSVTHMEVGGGFNRVDRKNNKIYFKISDPYALYISAAPLRQYSSRTLQLGSQRNPLPFYLAQKIQDQYFHDGNKERKPHNILAVRTLLDFCGDIIPTFEDVQQFDPGHWYRLIRTPLEKALNEIEEGGLFKWEYCKGGLKEVSKREVNTRDYFKWSQLYVTFQLIPDEPDQVARLEHKRESIEAALEKKRIKDAEKLIKADKIERRKADHKGGQ